MPATTLRLLCIFAALWALPGCDSAGPRHPPAAVGAPADAAGLPAPFEVPQTDEWIKPGVAPAQRQLDSESCYRYAWGQVARDQRIDSDRMTLRDGDDGLGLTRLNQDLDLFRARKRRYELFDDCMLSKGYSPQS